MPVVHDRYRVRLLTRDPSACCVLRADLTITRAFHCIFECLEVSEVICDDGSPVRFAPRGGGAGACRCWLRRRARSAQTRKWSGCASPIPIVGVDVAVDVGVDERGSSARKRPKSRTRAESCTRRARCAADRPNDGYAHGHLQNRIRTRLNSHSRLLHPRRYAIWTVHAVPPPLAAAQSRRQRY